MQSLNELYKSYDSPFDVAVVVENGFGHGCHHVFTIGAIHIRKLKEAIADDATCYVYGDYLL